MAELCLGCHKPLGPAANSNVAHWASGDLRTAASLKLLGFSHDDACADLAEDRLGRDR